MRRGLSIIAALVAMVVWRSGRMFKNNILTPANFPLDYYTAGHWFTNCHSFKDESHNLLTFCEDETFWDLLDATGNLLERRVIVSCDPGRREWNTVMGPMLNPDPHGGLWLYTPAKAKAKPQRLALKGYPEGHDFHPLGLEIYPSYAGNASNLFVINHARQRTFVEQFSMSPVDTTQAVWVRTLVSNYFVSPNALALTSPTSFYVTNDHLFTRRMPGILGRALPIAETLLGVPLSWLSHVSIEEDAKNPAGAPIIQHSFAALGISFANGVAVSPDGQVVALAATSVAEIYFYSRSPETNTLKHMHTVPVPFCPDNIAFDGQGSLIAAGHSNFPALINVVENKPGAVAPSWVVSVSPRAQAEAGSKLPKQYDLRAPTSASTMASPVLSHEVETLLQSNGTGFSSSSTGLRDSSSGVLYVTGLYAAGLLVCRP